MSWGGAGAAQPGPLSFFFPGPLVPALPPPDPTQLLSDLLPVTAGEAGPCPRSCHQPSRHGTKDVRGSQASAASLAGTRRCQGDHGGEKLLHKTTEGQTASGPRGASPGGPHLVRILLGSSRHPQSRLGKLRCQAREACLLDTQRISGKEPRTEPEPRSYNPVTYSQGASCPQGWVSP